MSTASASIFVRYANSKAAEPMESRGASKYLYSTEEERLTNELPSPQAKPKLEKSCSLLSGNSETSLAKGELDLLAKLIGADNLASQQEAKDTFRINLFDPEPSEGQQKK